MTPDGSIERLPVSSPFSDEEIQRRFLIRKSPKLISIISCSKLSSPLIYLKALCLGKAQLLPYKMHLAVDELAVIVDFTPALLALNSDLSTLPIGLAGTLDFKGQVAEVRPVRISCGNI